MVRLSRSGLGLALLATACHAQMAQLAQLQQFGTDIIKTGLKTVLRMNDTQIERIMSKDSAILPPHPYIVDLTDDNWEAMLKTGTPNPFEAHLPADTVWVITVYGPDKFSHMYTNAMNDVASYNSSSAGGALPPEMRFARINYNTETILPTIFWVWKVPVIVIATDNLQHLRFLKVGSVPPFVDPISRFLNKRSWWENLPVWSGYFAPGGSGEKYLAQLGKAWAGYHYYLSKVPMFVILMFSGALMNFVLAFFHKNDATPTPAATPTTPARRAPATPGSVPKTATTSATPKTAAAAPTTPVVGTKTPATPSTPRSSTPRSSTPISATPAPVKEVPTATKTAKTPQPEKAATSAVPDTPSVQKRTTRSSSRKP